MAEEKRTFSFSCKWVYILSFTIPAIVFLIFMVIREVMPFGAYSTIIGDTAAGTFPSIMELYNKLHSGDGLAYSWQTGIGGNFWSIIMGYQMSPSIFLMMLFPKDMVENAFIWSELIRISLCGFTAAYFFMHSDVLKNHEYQKLYSLVLSVSYALSNAVLVYYHTHFWLDVYFMLPLVLLGLEYLVKKDKWKMYFITLTLTVVFHFYLAYLVCIFLVLWFLCVCRKEGFIKQGIRFAVTSIWSVLSSAFVLIPVYLCVSQKINMGYTKLHPLKTSNFWDFIDSMMPTSYIDIDIATYHTMIAYCGILTSFVALYFVIACWKKSSEELRFSLLAVFMCFALMNDGLTFLMHGFTMPHGLSNRFAFCTVFTIVYVSAMGLRRLDEAKWYNILVITIVGVLLFVGNLLWTPEMDWWQKYVITMLETAVFILTWILMVKKSISKKAAMIFISIVWIAEVACVAGGELYYSTVIDWRDEYSVNEITPLYRKYNTETGRMALGSPYDNIIPFLEGKAATGTYSAIVTDKYYNFHRNLGLATINTGLVGYYLGATPLTDLLFNVDGAVVATDYVYQGDVVDTDGKYMAVKNDNSVGYGFLTDGSLADVKLDDDNIFHNQNKIYTAMGGEGDLFTDIPIDGFEVIEKSMIIEKKDDHKFEYCNTILKDKDRKVFNPQTIEEAKGDNVDGVLLMGKAKFDYTVPEDMNLYLFVDNTRYAYTSVAVNGEEMKIERENLMFSAATFNIPRLKKGDKVHLQFYNYDPGFTWGEFSLYAAKCSVDDISSLKNTVTPMEVETRDGKGITGHIKTEKDGVVLMSMFDDGGFDAYVDGKKVELKHMADAMPLVPIEKGEHDIELKYHSPGAGVGAIISVLAIIAFVIVSICDKKQKKA